MRASCEDVGQNMRVKEQRERRAGPEREEVAAGTGEKRGGGRRSAGDRPSARD